jgi:hypothetical protein
MSQNASNGIVQPDCAATFSPSAQVVVLEPVLIAISKRAHEEQQGAGEEPAKKAKAETKAKAKAAEKAKAKTKAKAKAAEKAKAEKAEAAKKAKAKKAEAAKKAKAEAAKKAKGKIAPETTGAHVQLQFGTGTPPAPAVAARDAPIDVDVQSFTEQQRGAKLAQIAPQCKCKACELCHRDTRANDWCYGVQCGRECPGCGLFHEMYDKAATFTVNGVVYTGCSTCMMIDECEKVSELCKTCFTWSCKKRVGSDDKEDPLHDGELRLYRRKGIGLAAGVCLDTMCIQEAREYFSDLGEMDSLVRLTPEGADGAMKK